MSSIVTRLAALAFVLLSVGSGFAMGTKESDFKDAEGTENWQRDIDISSYPPGTYNIYVQAKDEAGNVGVGGPFNVKIDPKSALPIVRVLNPLPGQRVGGDLTIVGTCSAKRGVGRVELSIDGGDFMTAEGGDLWTLVVKTAQIPDGRRTLIVRGVDVKGLVGPETKLVFDLDHFKPAVEISSPGQGALVAGSVKLAGTVSDANGIRSLELSLDGQKTWKLLGLSGSKKKDSAGFSVAVDSKKLGDGPRVLWFRAVDGVGSSALSAHLLVVDNTPPTISLARPIAKAAVHGRFLVAGTVHDLVGIKRLSFVFDGSQKGEIELNPGDPYFAREFDCATVKGSAATILLTLEDRVGNITRLTATAPIDRQAEKPRLTILFPETGGRVRAGQSVVGSVTADAPPTAVRWSIDGGKSVDTEATDTFSFTFPDLAAGKHVISLAGLDSAGRLGDPKLIPFVYDRGSAVVSFQGISAGPASGRAPSPGTAAYLPGVEVRVDGGQSLDGSVLAPNPPTKADWKSASGGASHPLVLAKTTGDSYGFHIPIDRSLPFGFAGLLVEVTDALGKVSTGQALLYVTDYAQAREDTGFAFEAGRADQSGKVEIGPGDSFRAAFFREELKSLRLDPPTDLVAATSNGRAVDIAFAREGVSGPTRVLGTTTSGHEFSAGPFIFDTDRTPPSITLDSPAQGAWIRGGLELRGKATDGGGAVALSWRLLPDGQAQNLAVGAGGAFSLTLSGAQLPTGSSLIEIEGRDPSGNVSHALFAFGVSTTAPILHFLSPEPGFAPGGPEDVAATIEDPVPIASVEYAEDGANFSAIDFRDDSFVHRADFSAHPGARYRVTDRAGNVGVAAPVSGGNGSAAAEPGSPAVPGPSSGGTGPSIRLIAPATGTALDSGARPLVFAISDAGGLASASLQLGGAKTSLPVSEGGRYYAILVDPRKGGKAPALTGTLVATNKVGKSSTLAINLPLTPEWGRPKVELLAPAESGVDAGSSLAARAGLGGTGATLDLAVDGTSLAHSECGSIGATLPELAAGKHHLRISATLFGDRTTVLDRDFVLRGAPPSFSDLRVGDAKSKTPWSPGLLVDAESPLFFVGSLVAPNGPASLRCSLDGKQVPVTMTKAAAPQGKGASAPVAESFVASLPALPFGSVTLMLEATDSAGLTTSRSYEFITTLTARSGEDNADGIRFYDSAIVGDGPDRVVKLDPSGQFIGRFQGRAIKSAGFDPPVDFLKLSFDGSLLRIQPTGTGVSTATSIRLLTVDGDSFAWGPASFIVDGAAPALTLDSPAQALWTRDSLTLTGTATDDLGIASVEYSVQGSSFQSLQRLSLAPPPAAPPAAAPAVARPAPPSSRGAASPAAGKGQVQNPAKDNAAPAAPPPAGPVTEYRFDQKIAVDQQDGLLTLLVRVRDLAGKETTVQRLIHRDTEAPQMTQVLPPPGERVSDPLTFVGEIADAGALESVQFTAPPPKPAPASGAAAGPPQAAAPAASAAAAAPAASAAAAANVAVTGLANFSARLDAIKLDFPLPEGGGFVAIDKAGNRALLSPAFSVDRKAMLPVVEIHTPPEDEVLRQDFAITGVAYDAAGVAAVDYRLDGSDWKRLTMEGLSFSIPMTLSSLADNGHMVEFRAENIFGLQGEIATRHFRISLAEPAARLDTPPATQVVGGSVQLSGSASDGNGIKEMALSVDSGASFLRPEGTESWNFVLDTRLLQDGPHAVALKPRDKYDTLGFAAGLITVDNTPPEVALDLPLDGDTAAQQLLVSGRASDNLGLASTWIEILPAGKALPPVLKVELGTGRVIRQKVDITGLDPGTYTVRLVARDRAGNQSLASKDVSIVGRTPPDSIQVLYPQPGAQVCDRLRVSAQAHVAGGASQVEVLIDGSPAGSAVPDARGYFSLDIAGSSLSEGRHRLAARALAPDGRSVSSSETDFEFKTLGPWIAIDSFKAGAFLPPRPFIKGHAGWSVEKPDSGDKVAVAAFNKAQALRAISSVEYSLDGGTTFSSASGGAAWSFRLETQEFGDGPIYLLVRARYKNGESATSATLLDLDKTAPTVNVLAPREGDRQFETMRVIGTARDADGVDTVRVALRKGDKAAYQVPSFIQGLYADGHFLGATDWEAGLGLTFFNDNVKLQAEYGSAPATDSSGQAQSFYGDVFGAKLIANIAYLPMNYILGPDWSFLSASFGLGADFTYFTQTQSGGGLLVGAVFGQLEFPTFTMKNWTAFRKYSFYTEYQVWVLSSVVSGGFIQRLSFGVRVGLF